jgi:Macrocin-O-methyltransferase (TylF)
MDPRLRYLELLKKSILNEIYIKDEERILYLRNCLNAEDQFEYHVLHDIATFRPDLHVEFKRSRQIGQFPFRKISNSGFQHSMIGRVRMDSLHDCMDKLSSEGVAGDLVECGVWRGGVGIFMQGYLESYDVENRRVILADSFKGLPKPTIDGDPDLSSDLFPQLAVDAQEVRENFACYDLWNDNVVLLEGWFSNTLPEAPTEEIALLRADGDLYSSTTDILTSLYDRVTPGGFVIIDDYGVLPQCARAVKDFFALRGKPMPELTKIDWSGVLWRKAP